MKNQTIEFNKLKCKNYPNPCYHEPDYQSIYEHGICGRCEFIPDIVIDWYIKNGVAGWKKWKEKIDANK